MKRGASPIRNNNNKKASSTAYNTYRALNKLELEQMEAETNRGADELANK